MEKEVKQTKHFIQKCIPFPIKQNNQILKTIPNLILGVLIPNINYAQYICLNSEIIRITSSRLSTTRKFIES